MKLFAHGFWSGFFEKTNSLHVDFFVELFEEIFREPIEIGQTMEESDILLETVFDPISCLFSKQWKYSFLFSGESSVNRPLRNKERYTCVLMGERNHDNVINTPLFVPYLFCSDLFELMKKNELPKIVPPKNICAIISNANGTFRNDFLDKLDKVMHVDYCGDYKNNCEKNPYYYNTAEFREEIGKYKFIISMENTREDTYITEKITHGLLANTIPIYWGSPHIFDYFNKERFICIESEKDFASVINTIISLTVDENKYLDMILKPIYKNDTNQRDIYDIVGDVRNLLSENMILKSTPEGRDVVGKVERFRTGKIFSLIDQIYFVNSPIFEPEAHERLLTIFEDGVPDNVKFISPTYKHTITDDMVAQHITKDLMIETFRKKPMKRSELSLFLNYKAVLEHIVQNYSDGVFLIFESDVFVMENIVESHQFIRYVLTKCNSWDLIHIGYDRGNEQDGLYADPYCVGATPYRPERTQRLPFIEDITNETDHYHLIRKFHTRCCDSFIWNYSGVVKFLNHMNTDTNYGAAFDYYMTNFFETHPDFKHYWSDTQFFVQGSNHGMVPSTIQKDID